MEATGRRQGSSITYHPLKGLKITLYLLHGSGLIRLHIHPDKFPGWDRIPCFQVYLFPSLDQIIAPKHAGACCGVRLSCGHEST